MSLWRNEPSLSKKKPIRHPSWNKYSETSLLFLRKYQSNLQLQRWHIYAWDFSISHSNQYLIESFRVLLKKISREVVIGILWDWWDTIRNFFKICESVSRKYTNIRSKWFPKSQRVLKTTLMLVRTVIWSIYHS